uniref:Prokineticin domain-containing protein n=1 Tax=Tetranychus urticae TaxID=32264 RepID=T1L158_TETUR
MFRFVTVSGRTWNFFALNSPKPCQSSDDCRRGECCAIGKFSVPMCKPMGRINDWCYPDNEPENMTLHYPYGSETYTNVLKICFFIIMFTFILFISAICIFWLYVALFGVLSDNKCSKCDQCMITNLLRNLVETYQQYPYEERKRSIMFELRRQMLYIPMPIRCECSSRILLSIAKINQSNADFNQN